MNAPRASSPRHRPPLAVRAFVGLLGTGVVLFNAALMVSDRAPGALERMFGDVARRLSARIDADARARLVTDGGLPPSDTIVHVAVWAVAMALVGFTVWSWRGLAVSAVAVFACSVAVELAQGRWSDTRVVEPSDVAANGLGVLVGVAVVVAGYVAWTAIAGLWGSVAASAGAGRDRRDDGTVHTVR